MPLKTTPAQTAAAICLILIPVAVFGYVFRKYALNIPHWDDLAVRNSLADFLTTNSLTDKFRILFAQHNEHRIFLTRVFALIVFQFTGTLNLKALMLLGNLALVGILFLFYRYTRRSKLPLLALVPVSFLLFTNSLYENVFWGMASVQNFWVILLAFLSLYFLVYSYNQFGKTYFALAVLCCFAGTFTSSNGILIPIIGTAVLLLQKRHSELRIWGGVSVLFLFLYFFGYQPSPDKVASVDFSAPGLLFKGMLAVLGSSIDVSFIAPGRHLDLSMTTGVIILILSGLFGFQVLFRRYNINQRNSDLFLLSCMVFLAITCAGIVAGRIAYGIEVVLTSKYKIYSVLLLCLCYLVALQSVNDSKKDRFIKIILGLSVLYNIYTYLADYPHVSYMHRERITDQFKMQVSDKQMPTQGIYASLQQPAPTFYNKALPFLSATVDSVNIPLLVEETETGFRLTDRHDDTLKINTAAAGQYFLLRSAQHTYLFPSRAFTPHARPILDYINIGFLFGNQLQVSSFVSEFSKFYLQSGTYQIGTMWVEKNLPVITWTNHTINIKAVQKEKTRQNW